MLNIECRPVPAVSPGSFVKWIAANKVHRNGSFSGSGLPYANQQMAFDNTPNKGDVYADVDGIVKLTLKCMPASYYTGLGTVQLPPCVHLTYKDTDGKTRKYMHKVANPLAYRTLSYPVMRHESMFYYSNYPARSQDDILHASAYPEKGEMKPPVDQKEFWNGKPPM